MPLTAPTPPPPQPTPVPTRRFILPTQLPTQQQQLQRPLQQSQRPTLSPILSTPTPINRNSDIIRQLNGLATQKGFSSMFGRIIDSQASCKKCGMTRAMLG